MRITRVRLQNWKNFTNLDVSVRERTFLVGPNASGKSNFLDVIRFMMDMVRPGGGLERALQRLAHGRDARLHDAGGFRDGAAGALPARG